MKCCTTTCSILAGVLIGIAGTALIAPLVGAAGQDKGKQPDMKKGEHPTMPAPAIPAPPGMDMDDAMMAMGAPGPEHKLLAKMIGTWKAKMTGMMDADGVSVNSPVLGGRFIRQDFTANMGGMEFVGLGYSGYDNVKKKYIGTWSDISTTSLMVSEGDYDAKTMTFTHRGEMFDPEIGEDVKVREVTRMVSDDEHTFEMFGPDKADAKKEVSKFKIVYTREKADAPMKAK